MRIHRRHSRQLAPLTIRKQPNMADISIQFAAFPRRQAPIGPRLTLRRKPEQLDLPIRRIAHLQNGGLPRPALAPLPPRLLRRHQLDCLHFKPRLLQTTVGIKSPPLAKSTEPDPARILQRNFLQRQSPRPDAVANLAQSIRQRRMVEGRAFLPATKIQRHAYIRLDPGSIDLAEYRLNVPLDTPAADWLHFSNFLEAVRAGDASRLRCPAEEGLRTFTALAKAMEALETGRTVEVEPG